MMKILIIGSMDIGKVDIAELSERERDIILINSLLELEENDKSFSSPEFDESFLFSNIKENFEWCIDDNTDKYLIESQKFSRINYKKIKTTKNKSKQQVTTKFMWHKQK